MPRTSGSHLDSERSTTSFTTAGSDTADVGAAAATHTVALQNKTDGRIWVGSTVNAYGSTALTGLFGAGPGRVGHAHLAKREGAGTGAVRSSPARAAAARRAVRSTALSGTADRTLTTAPWANSPPDYRVQLQSGPLPGALVRRQLRQRRRGTRHDHARRSRSAAERRMRAVAGRAEDDMMSVCLADSLVKDRGTGTPLVCVTPDRDHRTGYSDVINQKRPTACAWSRRVSHSCVADRRRFTPAASGVGFFTSSRRLIELQPGRDGAAEGTRRTSPGTHNRPYSPAAYFDLREIPVGFSRTALAAEVLPNLAERGICEVLNHHVVAVSAPNRSDRTT